jgi:hypothetical protein
MNGVLGVLVQQLVGMVFKLRRDLSNKKQRIMESNVMATVLKLKSAISKNAFVSTGIPQLVVFLYRQETAQFKNTTN